MSRALSEAKWRQFLVDLQVEWPARAVDVTKARDFAGLVSLLQQSADLPGLRIALEIQLMLRVFKARLNCAKDDAIQAA